MRIESQGPSTVSASPNAIVEMIKDASGETFESLPSFNQSLTFDKTQVAFQQKSKTFASSEMLNFRLLLNNKVYTNLAELLSDQCTQRIRIAVFDDTNSIQVKQRVDVGGSLLNQVEEAYQFLLLTIPTRSRYEGLNRIDYYDFPLHAVREALMNLIVHRDYSMNADARINVYPNRIEFISPGGLPNRVTPQDLENCLSIRRNPNLARVFEKLGYIEAMGIGLPLIRDAYKNNHEKPIIQPAPNSFRVVLPKLFSQTNKKQISEEGNGQLQDIKQKQLIEMLSKYGPSSRLAIQEHLDVSQPTASRLINELIDLGHIIKIKNGRSHLYALK